jgi:F420-dependent oxidoreductase-like protein
MLISVMIEGQEDVTWEQWRSLAQIAEQSGFHGLYRSDHYLSVGAREERGALDAWGTICALAALTERVRLGTVVSPASFRHPSILAKLVTTADHVSGGRVELGLGAGWHELEHHRYGFPFLPARERFDVLEEQLEIITRQWREGPFSFHGEHYAIEQLDARPKPVARPRPLLRMGGAAKRRAAALAARFADEYNAVLVGPERVAEVRAALDGACIDAGRDPATLPLSLMTGFLVGRDREELRGRAERLLAWQGRAGADLDATLEELGRTWIVGTPDEAAARLDAYAAAGVTHVMLQHLLVDDDAALELIAERFIA